VLFGAYIITIGFVPHRFWDKIPKYAVTVGHFNIGIWLGISVVLLTFAVTLAMNKFFYKLPGKYFNYIAISALPIGYAIHRFKRFNQIYYGAVEILFGIATAAGTTLGIKNFGGAQGITIMGAIYVVARGFNNIYDAQQAAEKLKKV
jgi:hypothetical protein